MRIPASSLYVILHLRPAGLLRAHAAIGGYFDYTELSSIDCRVECSFSKLAKRLEQLNFFPHSLLCYLQVLEGVLLFVGQQYRLVSGGQTQPRLSLTVSTEETTGPVSWSVRGNQLHTDTE